MVRLREVIEVERPLEEAFAFAGDFANAERWDPGVRESHREGTDPVGVGAAYRLIVTFRKRSLRMTYRIAEFDPPHRVVLTGRGATVRAVDEIRFERAGQGRTRISYRADLHMRGPLALAEPFLRGAFDRMGKLAVAGLRDALNSRADASSRP